MNNVGNSARILDGKALAASFHAAMTQRSAEIASHCGRKPGLGVILVGDNPASKTYVASKEKTAAACGLSTFEHKLSELSTAADLEQAIDDFNQREEVDGILLQLPLPAHLDAARFIQRIDPGKDADGLHPANQGLLITGNAGVRPCTPLGSMFLLDVAFAAPGTSAEHLQAAELAGKSAVVVGRSILVGKPLGLLLLERNATVTYAHSKTLSLPEVCRSADVLVAAVGKAELIRGGWIKPGAVVIDVGINRNAQGKLVGDVAFSEAIEIASAVTPVPGGVGPMTVAMLIRNTLQCCISRKNLAVRL